MSRYHATVLLLFASGVRALGQTNALDAPAGASPPSAATANMTNHIWNVRKEEVQILLAGNQSFKGTLRLPESRSRVPAALIIPGFVPGAKNESEEAWRGDLRQKDCYPSAGEKLG